MSVLEKFELGQDNEIKNYFDEHGYVVIKSVVEDSVIDRFIEAYERIKKSKLFVYYSQSKHLGMRPKLNKFGYIQESMQNASRLAFYKAFSQGIKRCIYHPKVADALTSVTGDKNHVSWQNMFFDQSTGTVEHQDSWYLDTEPSGDLCGVWFALEDIDPNCGPFFVLPGSHKSGLIDAKDFPKHTDFVAAVKDRMDTLAIPRKPMPLSKGDILLWHPFLIHGAFNCEDESLSRKSFTSHYYPKRAVAKDTESKKILSTYNHTELKSTIEPRLESAFRFNDYFYNLLVFALYVKDALLSAAPRMKMRRDDYK